MLRRLAVVTAALLLLGFATPRVPEVFAEDKLNPPLVGMHEVSDPAGMVTISVPEHVEPGGVDPNPSLLACWKVWLYDDTTHHLTVWLSRKSAFARAPLHASMTGAVRSGTLVEGSGPRGTNEWWETRKDAGQYRAFRMIEHGGEVFEAGVSCSEQAYPIVTKHLEVILSSFKGAGKPTPPAPPSGFKVSQTAGREVWTNDKSKPEVDRVLALHTDTWERMKTLLPPFAETAPPRVIICKDSASYNDMAKGLIGGQIPPYAFDHPPLRAVVVMPAAVKDGVEFERQVRRAVGIECSRAAFGGPVPYWLENGLAIENLFIGPKPLTEDKPNPTAVREAKALFSKRKETLADLMDSITPATPQSDLADLDRLSWAWNWYLRQCRDPASDEGGRYRKYLETFEKTGDALAARAVWDGSDFKQFRASMEKWFQSK